MGSSDAHSTIGIRKNVKFVISAMDEFKDKRERERSNMHRRRRA